MKKFTPGQDLITGGQEIHANCTNGGIFNSLCKCFKRTKSRCCLKSQTANENYTKSLQPNCEYNVVRTSNDEVLMQRTSMDGPPFHLLGKNEDTCTELSKLCVSTNDDHLMLKTPTKGPPYRKREGLPNKKADFHPQMHHPSMFGKFRTSDNFSMVK